MYFEVFRVQPCLRTRYATLGFQGNAALWFQGVEAKGRVENWEDMCHFVHDYFGKNKQASYRYQLHVLLQTGSVSEYWDKFSRLRHQLLLYNPYLDEGHFIDEFIVCLKEEIRASIWLHRPQELETLHLLALMQEEEVAPSKKRLYSKHEFRYHSKSKWPSHYSDDMKNELKQQEGHKTEEKLDALEAFPSKQGFVFYLWRKVESISQMS
jgi:hypothetical protein